MVASSDMGHVGYTLGVDQMAVCGRGGVLVRRAHMSELLGLSVALSSLFGRVEMHLQVAESRLVGLETSAGEVLSKQGNEGEPNEVAGSAGQRTGNVVRDPCALDLEVSSSDSSDDSFEVRRVVNQLHNVRLGVTNGLPEASEMHISSVVVPDDPLVVDLVLVDGEVVSFVYRGGVPFLGDGLGAGHKLLLIIWNNEA